METFPQPRSSREARSMALDPQAKAVIDLVVKSGRPAYHTLSPKDARQLFPDTRPAAPPPPAGVPLLPRRRLGDRRPRPPRRRVPAAQGGVGRQRRVGGLPAGARAQVPNGGRRRVGGPPLGRRPRR